MRKGTRLVTAICGSLALFGLLAIDAGATTYVPQKFSCPIGGEKFKSQVVASNSTFGARPDGMPYSPLPIYPLIECPKNGFILFDETFTPAEISQLEPLVASAEFQAMRTTETPHYRAWWLMRAVGRDAHALTGALLQATWEAGSNGALKTRYQAAFVEAAQALEHKPGKEQAWFWLNLRAANALRELGRFDAAREALDQIDKPELLPAEQEGRATARWLISGLRALATEGNRVAEPANLIPRYPAEERCKASDLSASEIAACEKLKSQAAAEEAVPSRQSAAAVTKEAAETARAAANEAAAEKEAAQAAKRYRSKKPQS